MPQGATRLTLPELERIYSEKRQEIRDRLGEFEKVGRTGSHQRFFEELTFCIFTAGASARMGLRSVEGIRSILLNGSSNELKRALVGKHRFPNSRGAYVYETREYLRLHCGLKLRHALKKFDDRDERRDFLAANQSVRGIGYKEASHFLRNVGYRGYAILDKHMLSEALRKKVYGPHAAENWPPSFRGRFRSVACGPVRGR